MVPQLGFKVAALGELVDGMDARRDIPQIEFITGDADTALVFRHLQPLSDADKDRLAAFADAHAMHIFLQPGGIDSVHPLAGEAPQLAFRLPQWDIELQFRPLDFIQVNARLNEAMIARALELLDVQPGERVAVQLPNGVDWLRAALGALRALHGDRIEAVRLCEWSRREGRVVARLQERLGALVEELA